MPAPGLSQNLGNSYFSTWIAALDNVYNNSAPARIAFIGDSTTEGTGAGSFQNNYVQQLKVLMDGMLDIPVVDGAVWGYADDYTDARISLGTGWSIVELNSWGPRTLTETQNIKATTSATGDLTITFPHSFDRIVVYYPKNTGLGTFTVNVDGGSSLGSVNTAGTLGVGKTTFSCSAGTHVIHIPPPTVGDVYILGVEAYLSTDPPILMSNAGSGGTKASDWISGSTPWGRKSMFSLYDPDLSIIMLGINDAAAAVSASTYETNMTTLVTEAQLYGDVLLMSVAPSQNSTTASYELQYLTKTVNISTAKNCGFLDINAAFVDYATANAAGYMSDIFHPSSTGYGLIASLISTYLPLGPNVLPTAAFTATATGGIEYQFNASTSTDSDGSIASYAWTFGDGGTGTGVSPKHVYAAAGTYAVTLTVTDNRGGTDEMTSSLSVTASTSTGTTTHVRPGRPWQPSQLPNAAVFDVGPSSGSFDSPTTGRTVA